MSPLAFCAFQCSLHPKASHAQRLTQERHTVRHAEICLRDDPVHGPGMAVWLHYGIKPKSFQPKTDGLQPRSDGLRPNSVGL